MVSWPPWFVRYLIKAVVAGFLGLLAFLCRTKTTDRRDPRLLGEFALVVLTMLFVSERSWKHHYVTVLLPITYLVSEFFSPHVGQRGRMAIAFAWAMSFGLMASTSTDIGGIFFDGQGHEIAQGYGLFMWAGVVLYGTVGCACGCGGPRSLPRGPLSGSWLKIGLPPRNDPGRSGTRSDDRRSTIRRIRGGVMRGVIPPPPHFSR